MDGDGQTAASRLVMFGAVERSGAKKWSDRLRRLLNERLLSGDCCFQRTKSPLLADIATAAFPSTRMRLDPQHSG